MKTKLLSLALCVSAASWSQATHVINWYMGIPPNEASLTIPQGDIVQWTLTDGMPHTVTSDDTASESFDSGLLSGAGSSFSHQFDNVGDSEYRCSFHPSMDGVITVQSLSVNDTPGRTFAMYPNPVNDVLTIESADNIDALTITDASGKIVLDVKLNTAEAKIYMSNYPAGNYFVRSQSAGKIITRQIVKQ